MKLLSLLLLTILPVFVGAITTNAQEETTEPDRGTAIFIEDKMVKGYYPYSTMVAPFNPKTKPLYPVVDIHTHFPLDTDVQFLIRKMDELGLKRVVNLSGGWGDELDQKLNKFHRSFPGRIDIFFNIDFSRIDEDDFGNKIANDLKEAHANGVSGIKLFKNFGLTRKDKTGNIIALDDERLDPIWQMAGELDIPVLQHIADPTAFFEPIDEKNERWLQLARHPDWSFYGDEFPSRSQLFAQRDRLITNHPNTKFIGAHIGSHADDLAAAAAVLEKHANFYVEISGRVAALGRQPYSARKFLMKYQDRVMFGTDRYPGRPDQPRYKIYYRFLETDDEYFEYYDHPFPPTGEWKIYGVYLPEDVLKKIYYQNAEKIMGK